MPDATDADTVDKPVPTSRRQPSFPVPLEQRLPALRLRASLACHGASRLRGLIFVDMQLLRSFAQGNPATGPLQAVEIRDQGQPDASVLLQKIDAAASSTCGDKMPSAAGTAPEDAQAVRD
ncbi:MAG: hypothetical protein H6747_12635 [Deltaproteobacteria bacterium]|nr:hypothetical protein [Deltaproteobacteria bacterium]